MKRQSPQLSEKEWAELIEESSKKVAYRLYPPCLWFPELDIPSTFCRALGTFEEEAAKIVNPKIKRYFANLMMEGDTYCESVFEEREG
jgi:hypothetical protein